VRTSRTLTVEQFRRSNRSHLRFFVAVLVFDGKVRAPSLVEAHGRRSSVVPSGIKLVGVRCVWLVDPRHLWKFDILESFGSSFVRWFVVVAEKVYFLKKGGYRKKKRGEESENNDNPCSIKKAWTVAPVSIRGLLRAFYVSWIGAASSITCSQSCVATTHFHLMCVVAGIEFFVKRGDTLA
jgi:hypothetical protein